MSIELKMPMLSPTMTKGLISNWLVQVGDEVSAGDIVVEVEADKVTIEVEAPSDGVVTKLCADIGEELPVAETIMVFAAPGTQIELERNDKPHEDKEPNDEYNILKTEEIHRVENTEVEPPESKAGTLPSLISPLARRMVIQESLDASTVIGTGAKGKVMKRDIEKLMGYSEKNSSEDGVIPTSDIQSLKVAIDYDTLPPFNRVKNSGMRSVVASRLTSSSRDIPHFYMSVDCQLDRLFEVRQQLNSRESFKGKVSVNDFIVKAVASAMKSVPQANCMWDNDSVIYFDEVDVSVAVAIKDGLITPVIKGACQKGLGAISESSKSLVNAAREGKLQPSDYQGGTFTVSNLGMFGIDNFTSIINPPQNGILSVGAGKQIPVVENCEIVIKTMMTVTLAMDHRCVDGAIGAEFITAFKNIIEDPISLML